MIKITNIQTCNWDATIRGMRNPMESHAKSDTDVGCDGKKCCECGFKPDWCGCTPKVIIGPNDLDLMKRLVNAGTDHSKFMRMITVSFDMTAPLYFWKEFDTYRIGVVRNSCSTMHKIEARKLTIDDFATDDLLKNDIEICLQPTIDYINELITMYKETAGDKLPIHRRIVKLLPDSYLQRATITTNYQVLRNIRNSDRKTHKLTCWHEFCHFIDTLPYAKELLIEDEEFKYNKALEFVKSYKLKHNYTMTREEIEDDKRRLCDDFDGDFDTDAQSKAFQEALQGIKTYAEKKDPCTGLTCYSSNGDGSYTLCPELTTETDPCRRYRYYNCQKKGTGIAIPERDIVEDVLVIEPKAFNGEEF